MLVILEPFKLDSRKKDTQVWLANNKRNSTVGSCCNVALARALLTPLYILNLCLFLLSRIPPFPIYSVVVLPFFL